MPSLIHFACCSPMGAPRTAHRLTPPRPPYRCHNAQKSDSDWLRPLARQAPPFAAEQFNAVEGNDRHESGACSFTAPCLSGHRSVVRSCSPNHSLLTGINLTQARQFVRFFPQEFVKIRCGKVSGKVMQSQRATAEARVDTITSQGHGQIRVIRRQRLYIG